LSISRIPELAPISKGNFQKGIGALLAVHRGESTPSFSHLLPKYRIFLLSEKMKEEERRKSAGSSSLLLSVLLCTRESIRFGGFSATICDNLS
jgi:hypothetical protein